MAVLSQRTHGQFFRCRDLPCTILERQIQGILELPDEILEMLMRSNTAVWCGTDRYWHDDRLCEFISCLRLLTPLPPTSS